MVLGCQQNMSQTLSNLRDSYIGLSEVKLCIHMKSVIELRVYEGKKVL